MALSLSFLKYQNSKEDPVLKSKTGLALCNFIVEYLSMRYWMTGYLKLRLFWHLEIQSRYF